MLAPLLCATIGVSYICLELYIEYIKRNCFTTVNNLKDLCFFHLNSNRASILYSKSETDFLSKEIIESVGDYIEILNYSHCNGAVVNNEKCKKNMIRLIKIADDLNYITIQTSAHNIEIIVIYLIIQRTKLFNIIESKNRNQKKIKKIFRIIFLLCLIEMNLYNIFISFIVSFLMLKFLFLQN
jgi:hypothetical protein